MIQRFLRPVAFLLLCAVGACGDGAGVAPQVPTTIEPAGGSQQEGVAGILLRDSIATRVLDADGRPVAGVQVTFTVTAGNGSVSPGVATTSADGYARAAWTLGTTAGAQRVAAGFAGGAADAAFTANALPGNASRLEISAGDGASAPVGAALGTALAVRVTDPFGNPVAGVSVTWVVTAGGGSAVPASSTSDAAGVARAAWTLGTRSGQNRLTASAAGAVVTFTAMGAPGPVSTLERLAGDNQLGRVQGGTALAPVCTGDVLPVALRVRALDRFGNPVDGVAIDWRVASGSVTPARATTNGAGEAIGTWTLGSRAGTQAAQAAAPGGTTAEFTARVTAGSAKALEIVSGDNQTGRFGMVLPEPLTVRVTDNCGNPVGGSTVRWVTAEGTMMPEAGTSSADGTTSSFWRLDEYRLRTEKRTGASLSVPGTVGVTVYFRAAAVP
jgi:protocatechuate 3,4-dioxygenase beta subunit